MVFSGWQEMEKQLQQMDWYKASEARNKDRQQ
jgi:hypothetical protein